MYFRVLNTVHSYIKICLWYGGMWK